MATLSGCSFIEHDYEGEYQQIVATINVVEGDFSSGDRHIYKYELLEYVWDDVESTGVYPSEDSVDDVLDELVIRELIYVELDRLFFVGDLVWRDGELDELDDDGNVIGTYLDYTDTNAVKESIYDMIDSELATIQSEIRAERDEDIADTSGTTTDDGSTSYPVPEAEEDEDTYPEEEEWVPQNSRIPGKYGSADKISIEVQALERFTLNIIELVEEGYAIYDEDLLESASDDFTKLIDENKYEELYLTIYNSYPIQFLVGDSSIRSQQLVLLQDHMYDNTVTVADSEVEAEYKTKLNAQKLQFDSDASTYVTAMSSADPILYRPNTDYFYVKHILLPFSEEQKAAYTAFCANPLYVNDEAAQLEYRERMVSEMVVYPHVDGYDDYENATTVTSAFNEIYSYVASACASQDNNDYESTPGELAEAISAFDDMIYKYNTDTGIFSLPNGYAVDKYIDKEAGETETYMEEFADAARDLYATQQEGTILPYYAVTDYGVHVMFYVADPDAGETSVLSLTDYSDYTRTETVYDVIYDEIMSAKQSASFTKWQDERIVYYMQTTDSVEKFVSTYEDIYEPYETDDDDE